MRSLSVVAFAAALTISAAASAGPVLVDFEGIASGAQVLDYYNGGGPAGDNFGITFESNALALSGGLISGQPAPGGTVMYWDKVGSVSASKTGGWTGSFSFYYAGASDLNVSILDAAGKTIASSGSLAGVGTNNCSSGVFLCNWNMFSLDFSGTASSVLFTGAADLIAVDNLTFGSTGGGGNVPEPGSLALAGLALAVMGARALRKLT